MNTIQKISVLVLFLLAFVLGIRLIHEPDLWWMLRTGEWITQHGVPKTDPFSFTFFGADWLNVKWLFEVMAYSIQRVFGTEWITLWQALINTLMIFVFWKITSLFSKKSQLSFVVIAIWVLTIWEFRMLNRPEMNTHLLSVVFLFLWLRFRTVKDWLIWLVIPLQILWTNLHEAYAIGVVISVGFILGEIIESYKSRNKLVFADFKVSIIVAVASGLSTIFHPYGWKMLIQPFEIFSQLGDNKFTTELYGISEAYYWDRREVYLALVGLISAGILSFLVKDKLKFIFKKLGWGYVINFLLFTYLATTAHRNLPFFGFMAFPLLYLIGVESLNKVSDKVKLVLLNSTLIASLVFIGLINSNWYYSKTNSPDRFGIGVSNWNNPIELSNFLTENNLSGKTFSGYLVSSYLLWDQKEDFKSYIDFRDLDVFPAKFFNQFLRMTEFPILFMREQEKQQFDLAILYRTQFKKLHKFFYHDPNWKLVYADKIGAVYVKRSKYPDLKEVSFNTYGPELLRSSFAATLSTLMWPFSSPIFYDRSEELIAAEYYESVSAYAKALSYIEQAKQNPKFVSDAQLMEAQLYLTMADEANTNQERTRILNKSISLYSQLERTAQTYFGMGYCYFKLQDPVNAQSALLKAIELDPEMLSAYSVLAECQNLFMRTDQRNSGGYAKKWFEYMLKAHEVAPNDDLTNFKLGVSYCQRNQCENAVPFLEALPKALPQLTDQENQVLKQCRHKCL